MFTTILAATDGSEHAGKAVALASDLAAKYDARLVLIHILLRGRLSDEMRHMIEVEHMAEPVNLDQPRRTATPVTMATALGSDEITGEHLQRVLEAAGRTIVEKAQRTAKEAGVKRITTFVDDGDPAQLILECAAKEKADLIVVGSRGLGDFRGLLLGSVSHKVSQLAECTCITVK